MAEAFTYKQWVETPPDVYALTQEQVAELHALFDPVRAYLEEHNIPAHFTFVMAIKEDLSSTLSGLTSIPSIGRATPEILLMANMNSAGVQGAVDCLDPLIDAVNERMQEHKPRIIQLH